MHCNNCMTKRKQTREQEKASAFVGKTFSLWVMLMACFGFFAPQLFIGYKSAITPLLGIVMFGMGLTLSTADFREVLRRPKDVAIGVVGHYIIMPGLAYLLAIVLHLPPEIAVGVILVRSVAARAELHPTS
jgi:BASS family bile acid:Na+ symporter